VRWLCAALAVFADQASLVDAPAASAPGVCDLLMKVRTLVLVLVLPLPLLLSVGSRAHSHSPCRWFYASSYSSSRATSIYPHNQALTRFIESDAATQKILHALGALAQAHADNRARLVKAHLVAAIDTILEKVGIERSRSPPTCYPPTARVQTYPS